MPADVERLFRTIAPALVLLAGCDAKEDATKAEVVAKASLDLGGGAAEPEKGTADPTSADAEEPVVAKVALPPDVGTPDAEPKRPDTETPVADTPEATPVETPPEGKPKGDSPKPLPPEALPRRKGPGRASCPSGTWCTDKASAKKHKVAGAKFSLGCPDNVTRAAGGLGGPGPRSRMRGLDTELTKSKRAEGTKDACCYGWYQQCPGGRPLLDDAGAPVVASLEAGSTSGWSSGRTPLVASVEARAFAAQAWLDDAAMEHASVASFGRVALELLSLGAPPELVEGAHLAALDEVRHAKACLSFARGCGAAEVEPGRLAVVPQRSADFGRFAADTFIEGCVGETIAALVVTRAAAGTEDGALRAALEEIAADEARHAALAWRMVSWAINRGGANVVAAVVEAADRLRPENAASSSASEPDGIGQLGRLSARELAQARHDGWTGIIDPMLATLRNAAAKAS